jgi:putative DNA primase/helicase
MQWRSKRWAEDDANYVVKLAIKTALSIYNEAADEEDEVRRQKLVEWAKSSQSRQHLNAMVDLAKAYLPATPDQFDSEPDLLNAQNCTIDTRTGRGRPHQREDYLTKICMASFDPTAQASIFSQFLARIFRGHPKLINYVQRAIGYGSQGMTTEQVLFFLYGTGANGKTTLLDAVMFAMGDYAGKADRDLLSATDGAVHPTNVADLKGKRLVVCSETNEGGRFDEAKLKDLVGETRIKARFMRQDFFEFTATHKVFSYSNHKPLVRGTDFGFWRRMRVIPFIERIGDEEKDRDLPAKLQAEADGILAWVVEGCRLWRSEGLGMPEEVTQATDGYRVEMDSIGAFLGESVLYGERMQATARDLYVSYTTWCDDNGEKSLSQKRLGTCLSERGLKSDRDSYTGRKIWLGIGLKTSAQPPP